MFGSKISDFPYLCCHVRSPWKDPNKKWNAAWKHIWAHFALEQASFYLPPAVNQNAIQTPSGHDSNANSKWQRAHDFDVIITFTPPSDLNVSIQNPPPSFFAFSLCHPSSYNKDFSLVVFWAMKFITLKNWRVIALDSSERLLYV